MFAIVDFGPPEALLLAFIILLLGVFLILSAIPAVLAFIVLGRIPAQYRKQDPGLAFLLLIPLFSLVWSFFVHPRVAQSLQGYYVSQGDASRGDCGATLALWLCICPLCAFIPLVGLLAGIAGLVLLITFYVKAFELSKGIPRHA